MWPGVAKANFILSSKWFPTNADSHAPLITDRFYNRHATEYWQIAKEGAYKTAGSPSPSFGGDCVQVGCTELLQWSAPGWKWKQHKESQGLGPQDMARACVQTAWFPCCVSFWFKLLRCGQGFFAEAAFNLTHRVGTTHPSRREVGGEKVELTSQFLPRKLTMLIHCIITQPLLLAPLQCYFVMLSYQSLKN